MINQFIFLSSKLKCMLWGLSQETWLELWSGAIGAFVSAVAAALVAWGVVVATNRHQARLAFVTTKQAALEAQRSRAIEVVFEFMTLLDDSISSLDNMSKDSFRPTYKRMFALVHKLGLIGGLAMNLRNLLFMWPPLIRELIHQILEENDPELRQATIDALVNAHSGFAVAMPVFLGDEPFDEKEMIEFMMNTYRVGEDVLKDTSRL